ncbi:MAG: hypothetical protein FD189_174 [Elusimicrobia bacterium]|nr:MAG: hypothetical protein FD154_326 [Elusimicrobiota bacterium]KAF0158182.1 MAG: hypothetical protein FD189_174 [Elusimicrobiota bacterium]
MRFRQALLIPFLLAACVVKPTYFVAPGFAPPAEPVALLPFENETVDLAAEDYLYKLAAERIAARGYSLIQGEPVMEGLKGIGITDAGQMASATPEIIGRAVGSGLLCYGVIEDFTFQNLGFVVRKSVKLRLKLVSAADGEVLYEGEGTGRDVKVYLDRDEARKAFVEQMAVKLVQNMLKSPLAKEAERAAADAVAGLPAR